MVSWQRKRRGPVAREGTGEVLMTEIEAALVMMSIGVDESSSSSAGNTRRASDRPRSPERSRQDLPPLSPLN